ncbi:hypothetical protein LBMAG34_2710 [Candidatus Saccharibacteria bacterium]|nr:hypothetical protein LBMAG34_2710 [Candidatus Saccharibacteria bacterium]
MKMLAKIFFVIAISFLSLALVQGKAEAQEWETTSASATPTSNRAACLKNANGNPIELNDFAVNISNITFNVDTGTFAYKVNVAWGRCNLQGELSRAYAIYGPTSICPISGWYGLNGTATDCVKYVGDPPYSPPSDLKCSGGRTNAQCTTSAFNAAIIALQDPGFLDTNNKRSYAQTFTIPNWTNVRSSSTSYSIKEQMCQYYKDIRVGVKNPIDVTNNRCESINITANWRKKLPPPPSLDVSCTPDSNTENAKITVKAVSSDPADSGAILIKEDYDKNPPASDRNLSSSTYTFGIDEKYRDNKEHTYFVSFKGLNKSIVFGPNSQCKVASWYYPWLQTSRGNVVAEGRINGQRISNGSDFLGARRSGDEAKEAEFLVISAVGGGGPFCSTYNYILTNIYATDQGDPNQCSNGAGYNFNSAGININNGNVDRVVGGTKQAFADNGANSSSTPSACNANGIATATVTTIPTTISTDCSGGVIYKLNSNTLTATTIQKGRVTIFVEGDLSINDSIQYANTAYADPKQVPNLAIVVSGNVNISSSVTRIDAAIYSGGTINTCNNNPQNCSTAQLKVNGSLSSKNGFNFNKTFINDSRIPAELIVLAPQNILFPPPGIEGRYFYDDADSYKLDSAEYDPRF